MINKDDIFNEYTLNIFTDAGSRIDYKTNKSVALCAVEAVTVVDGKIKPISIDSKVWEIPKEDSNHAEMLAFNMATKIAKKYADNFVSINIFSDSLKAIKLLKEDVFRWEFSEDGSIKSRVSDKEPYLVRDICDIINDIVSSSIHVSIYHISSHVSKYSKEQLTKAMKCFIDHNSIKLKISFDLLHEITRINRDVDSIVRNVSKRMNYCSTLKYQPVKITKDDILKYKELVN